MIRSFYELKVVTSLCNEQIERYDHRISLNGKIKVKANNKLEIKKRKAIEQLFNHIKDYRRSMDESRVERRLYAIALENLENHYTDKFRQYINFSVDMFVVRIKALKTKYENLSGTPIEEYANSDFYTAIDVAKSIEASARELLEKMNIYICSTEKLQPLHSIELYYTMTDYFHPANSLATKHKHELSKRLKPELTEALLNFNFTLAKQLLLKIRELSYH